jgi:hypothetical protein
MVFRVASVVVVTTQVVLMTVRATVIVVKVVPV